MSIRNSTRAPNSYQWIPRGNDAALRALRRFSAAFLVLFAAAAGARVVAAHLGAGANRLGRFGLGGPGLVLQLLLLALLAAFDLAGLFFRARRLDQEKVPDGFVVDALHHFFEESEGLFFELDQGVFL